MSFHLEDTRVSSPHIRYYPPLESVPFSRVWGGMPLFEVCISPHLSNEERICTSLHTLGHGTSFSCDVSAHVLFAHFLIGSPVLFLFNRNSLTILSFNPWQVFKL